MTFIAVNQISGPGLVRQPQARDPQGTVHASAALNDRDDIPIARNPSIDIPTLVIHGTEDAAIELEKAEAPQPLASPARGSKGSAGAGHQSNVDYPDEVTTLIRDFLA